MFSRFDSGIRAGFRPWRWLAFFLTVAAMTNLFPVTAWPCEALSATERYCVGTAKRDITPRSLKGIFLGGYGFGPERPAAGIAGRLFARALAIKQGTDTVVFCAIDTQGHFIAYSDGPFGAADIRRRVASDRDVPPQNVIIASTHDHAAPDDTGIWGGVPDEYLSFVANQTVSAIDAAIDNEHPAHLCATEADVAGKGLLANTLPSNYPMDTGLQSLVVKNASGKIIATLVNFSAHSDVLGRQNRLISPDWPGATAARLEEFAPDSICLVILSSAGRSEPKPSDTRNTDLAAAKHYGDKIAALVINSLAHSHPIQGPIGARQVFIREQNANQLLRRLNLGGEPGFLGSLIEKVLPLKILAMLGFKIYGARGVDLILRSTFPPYLSNGDVIGTVVGAVRIGDVFFAAVPVESFPETRLDLVKDIRAHDCFLFSLADDQLGYDPPEREAPAVKCYRPYDEALFMTSPKLGDKITRTLMEEARSLGFRVSNTERAR